jgi:hypothetical protein
MERTTEHISRRPKEDGLPGGSTTPQEEREREIDENLKDTFPASDPVPPKHVD